VREVLVMSEYEFRQPVAATSRFEPPFPSGPATSSTFQWDPVANQRTSFALCVACLRHNSPTSTPSPPRSRACCSVVLAPRSTATLTRHPMSSLIKPKSFSKSPHTSSGTSTSTAYPRGRLSLPPRADNWRSHVIGSKYMVIADFADPLRIPPILDPIVITLPRSSA
jgi:hypothetical protein